MKTNNFLQFFGRGTFCAQIVFVFIVGVNLATAQTTEFTYQGRLLDGTVPPTANYDFEFQLYAALTGGAPIGTQTRLGVPVTNGVFTVQLDFLPSAFPGTDRFLEIAVKPAGSPNPFTILNPRQPITYAPQAFRSLSAAQADLALNSNKLGGIDANQFVTGQVVRSLNGLTDNVTLAAGSNITITPTGNTLTIASTGGGSGGILNQTTLQTGANFNIDGTGTANIVNAATQYNLGGNRVLITPTATNIFVGRNAGNPTVTGGDNSFVGTSAGSSNTTGFNNSFFGSFAGNRNTMGFSNSFVGVNAGFLNTTGAENSFFGRSAGEGNTTGFNNSFFGSFAGKNNTTGSFNSFVGTNAGQFNTEGDDNSFFGASAGFYNTTGDDNSFFGREAGNRNTTGFSNSFFGRDAGFSNTTGDTNSFFGRSAGFSNTMGVQNSFVGRSAGFYNTTGGFNSFFGTNAGITNTTGGNNTVIGKDADVGSGNLSFATAIGASSTVSTSNTIALGRSDGSDFVLIPGFLTLPNLAVAGSTTLCRNSFDRVGTCSSSLRYKTNVQTFFGGLDIVTRLRPITFSWKDGGIFDVGFAAEEVEQIEPLLATYNKDGQVEGVKYGQMTTVLVNAVQQQQQIIERQQKEIDALKKLVCLSYPNAEICK